MAIPGHNLMLATLGVLILWFGWFGFNPGSTMGAAVNDISLTAANTNLAAAAAAIGALVWCLTNTLTNLRVLLAVGCVALPRVVTATARHRALPTTKMPSHLHKRICETPH